MKQCKACGLNLKHYDFDKEEMVGESELIDIDGKYTVCEGYGSPRDVSIRACPECKTVYLVD